MLANGKLESIEVFMVVLRIQDLLGLERELVDSRDMPKCVFHKYAKEEPCEYKGDIL